MCLIPQKQTHRNKVNHTSAWTLNTAEVSEAGARCLWQPACSMPGHAIRTHCQPAGCMGCVMLNSPSF